MASGVGHQVTGEVAGHGPDVGTGGRQRGQVPVSYTHLDVYKRQNLGKGKADAAGIVEVVATSGAPAVVETPGGAEDQAADIVWLRDRIAQL